VHAPTHTFAIHHVAQGTSLRTVQKNLGDADLKTTSVYVQLVEGVAAHIHRPDDSIDHDVASWSSGGGWPRQSTSGRSGSGAPAEGVPTLSAPAGASSRAAVQDLH